ncbi:hypothetical protein SAMN06297280_0812 [Arsukibacterium tuosuense]|uniref:Uncharacterized protein n=1 Tax=Arsukibacterium tuosuense TaxID=1323745 RepID=A0A285IB06_9GAMM|nr:hypothetical protein [Arsukibacterium tuosuense]SNY44967.1 hypothetical protein SAMN06297280_0812 [Arsukibacterium tuosuense]
MELFKNRILPLILGSLFVVASIVIIGIGAAVPVSADLLTPLVKSLGMFAFALVDLVTIAIPLAAAFLVLAVVSRLINRAADATFYALLLAPFMLFDLYYLLFNTITLTGLMNIVPRYILLGVCFYFLVRSSPKVAY